MLKKIIPLALVVGVATPALAKTHKFNYPQPCNVLWPAVKDTLRNSGKYGIIGISNEELTASYNIGGFLTGKRINSLVLNTIPTGCELQVQTSFSGVVNDDVDALKKRVDESLTKLGSAAPPPLQPPPPSAAKPTESTQP